VGESEAGPDLELLLPSWELHLRAERKSASTIKSYTDGVRAYIDFCTAEALPVTFDRRTVNAFVAALMDTGAAPATARSRQLAVRRFSAWATEEGEQSADPLIGLKAPKLDTPVVQPLTDDQLRALIKACKGRDFRTRRDEALIRLKSSLREYNSFR
jgi:site-specific recombinase XerD